MKPRVSKLPIMRAFAVTVFPVVLSACGGGSAGDVAGGTALLNNSAVVPASSPAGSENTAASTNPSGAPTAASEFNALTAKVFGPKDQVFDAACNLYIVSQTDAVIRKVAPDGTTTVFAGSPGMRGSNDGAGSDARFNFPNAITIDGSGNLYVTDAFTVRKITPEGVVTTIAGAANAKGDVDATGSAARFDNPSDLAVDADGNVFVSELDLHVIRKVTPDGTVTTFAGMRGSGTSVDGSLTSARFIGPLGLEFDTDGNLYVFDVTFPPSNFSPSNQALIRKISPDGVVTTIASDRDPVKTLKKLRKHWKAVPLDQSYCSCRDEDGKDSGKDAMSEE